MDSTELLARRRAELRDELRIWRAIATQDTDDEDRWGVRRAVAAAVTDRRRQLDRIERAESV
jgi:hypothetical protein